MRYLIPLIAIVLGVAFMAFRLMTADSTQQASAVQSSASAGASDPSLQYVSAAPAGVPLDRNFDSDLSSVRPADILSLRTGPGSDGTWLIQPDATAPSRPNVLAQISTDNSKNRFPIAIETKSKYKDVDLSVQIKVVDGQIDRSGGVIFRYQDENDYYLVQVNTRDNQIGLFRVSSGQLNPIATNPLTAPPNGWHALRILFKGDSIESFFDGVKQIEAKDNTLPDPGLIGFWTHADSVAHFDDLVVQPAN